MGQLQKFLDMTGQMTPAQVDDKNITNIIQELNRDSEQLDSLNNTINIVGSGTLSYTWNGIASGASPVSVDLISPITANINFMLIVFMSRSDDSDSITYEIPFFESVTNANGDAVMSKLFYVQSNTTTENVIAHIGFFANGTPATFTFYYFLIQQPTNITF